MALVQNGGQADTQEQRGFPHARKPVAIRDRRMRKPRKMREQNGNLEKQPKGAQDSREAEPRITELRRPGNVA